MKQKSRSGYEFIVSDPVSEILQRILDWLSSNGFRVLSRRAEQEIITFGSRWVPFDLKGPYLRLSVRKGSVVSVYLKRVVRRVYAVVFEVTLLPIEQRTQISLEAYAAGTGLLAGKEWDLMEGPSLIGYLPRKKGVELFKRFQQDFGG